MGIVVVWVTLASALGCGLMAGVFFAFSTFVMPALARLPPEQGIAAMNAINVAAINRWFMGALFGTAAACLVLIVASWPGRTDAGGRLRIAGGLLYVAGAIAVTMAFNVPLNDALAKAGPAGADAAALWTRYLADWTAYNHVRAVGSLLASATLTLALLRVRLAPASSLAVIFAALGLGGCHVDEVRPIPPPGASRPVARLSQLGLFEGAPARQVPRAGVVSYDVNVPVYADGAGKHRFVVVPPGARLHATADRWEVPVGAYWVKTFSYPLDARAPALGERLVETRFLVKTAEGLLASTYLWNDEQTDAVASAGDVDVPVTWIDARGAVQRQRHHVPGTSTCASCHAGRVLGFRSRQLDRRGTFADGTGDQIAHLVASGVVDARPPAHEVLSDPFGDAPLDARARSYLDGNCGHCHGSGGSAEGTRLLWDHEHTAADRLPVCRATHWYDATDRMIDPGHPDRSEIVARMRSSSSLSRMPRGPNRVADPAGVALISAWIASMKPMACAR